MSVNDPGSQNEVKGQLGIKSNNIYKNYFQLYFPNNFAETTLYTLIMHVTFKAQQKRAQSIYIRYLEIKGNGETTSSFPKFEISKLRPAKVHK